MGGSDGALACGAPAATRTAIVIPAANNSIPATTFRNLIASPSPTILAARPEVEKPRRAKYNLLSCLLAPAGAWYKKFRWVLPFSGLAPVFLFVHKEILMAYVIAEPCIGTKDTACVDVCSVDCIH